MNIKKKLIISITAVSIIGLSIFLIFIVFKNPMDIKITKNNYENILEKVRKTATKEDYEKVQAVIGLSQLASIGSKKEPIELIEGKSFNEIINNFKKNSAENEKKQELQKSIEKEKQKIRNSYIEAQEWSWEITKDKDNPYIKVLKVTMSAKNKKDINIDAFEATIGMYDKLDNKITSIDVKCTDKFSKNSKSDFSWKLSDTDNYEAVDAMSKEQGSDIYFEFIPTKILIADKEL